MLHRIIPFIVLILTVLDSFVLFGLAGTDGNLHNIVKGNELIVIVGILVQLPIIYFILYKAYISPVQLLNQNIAKFMTGIDEDMTMKTNAWSS